MQKLVATDSNKTPLVNPGPIQLLVVDIDGTIAGKSNDIREPVKQAIAAVQKKGVQVAIATGRMYRSALRFHQAIGSSLPLICYQGAWIQDPITQNRLQHLSVPKQMVLQLLDYFETPELRPVLSIHFYIDDELYVREMSQATAMYVQRSSIVPHIVGDLRLTLEREPTKVLALSDDPATIE